MGNGGGNVGGLNTSTPFGNGMGTLTADAGKGGNQKRGLTSGLNVGSVADCCCNHSPGKSGGKTQGGLAMPYQRQEHPGQKQRDR